MEEQWKDFPEFEGYYQVSNLCRIRGINKGRGIKVNRILKPHLHHSGYYTIGFSKNGKTKYLSLARVIAICWIPNPENKKEVNHKNGIVTDNRIENLEWVTPSENIKHYYYVLDKGAKRAVIQMNLDGNELNKFRSIAEAITYNNLPKSASGNIVMTCQNKYRYAYGYKWKYA